MTRIPPDFIEFLRLLNSHGVEYLLIGGYAIGYYGYPRPTADLDVWIATSPLNAMHFQVVLPGWLRGQKRIHRRHGRRAAECENVTLAVDPIDQLLRRSQQRQPLNPISSRTVQPSAFQQSFDALIDLAICVQANVVPAARCPT